MARSVDPMLLWNISILPHFAREIGFVPTVVFLSSRLESESEDKVGTSRTPGN